MSDKAEARHEISKLIYAYSEALDGGDLERVGDIQSGAAAPHGLKMRHGH